MNEFIKRLFSYAETSADEPCFMKNIGWFDPRKEYTETNICSLIRSKYTAEWDTHYSLGDLLTESSDLDRYKLDPYIGTEDYDFIFKMFYALSKYEYDQIKKTSALEFPSFKELVSRGRYDDIWFDLLNSPDYIIYGSELLEGEFDFLFKDEIQKKVIVYNQDSEFLLSTLKNIYITNHCARDYTIHVGNFYCDHENTTKERYLCDYIWDNICECDNRSGLIFHLSSDYQYAPK